MIHSHTSLLELCPVLTCSYPAPKPGSLTGGGMGTVFLIAAPAGAPRPPKKTACLPSTLAFTAGWDSAASPAPILGEVVPMWSVALRHRQVFPPIAFTPQTCSSPVSTPPWESGTRRALCCFLHSCPLRTSAQTLSLWSPSLPPTFPALPHCLPSLSNRADCPLLEHSPLF